MSKPVLYRFGLSIWAAIAELTVIETGLFDQIQQETLVLVEGENLELEFVKKNPTATLPTLITPDGTVYDSSDKVVDYLLKHGAKVGELGDLKLVELIHGDDIEPNLFFIGARSDEELKAKSASVPGAFLRGRQKTLERVAPTAPPELNDFYQSRIKANGGLLAIYMFEAPEEAKQAFFGASEQNWKTIGHFVINVLPTYLPQSGFIGGDMPGQSDFFAGAYIARIACVLGAKNDEDGWKAFEVFGDVPAKVQSYWSIWFARESWKVVYKDGLH